MLQCVIYVIYALLFLTAARQWVGGGENISLGGRRAVISFGSGYVIQYVGDLKGRKKNHSLLDTHFNLREINTICKPKTSLYRRMFKIDFCVLYVCLRKSIFCRLEGETQVVTAGLNSFVPHTHTPPPKKKLDCIPIVGH